jgi:hypothetical protein
LANQPAQPLAHPAHELAQHPWTRRETRHIYIPHMTIAAVAPLLHHSLQPRSMKIG